MKRQYNWLCAGDWKDRSLLVLVVLAIAHQWLFAYYYPCWATLHDTAVQVGAAQNLLDGGGYTQVIHSATKDLSDPTVPSHITTRPAGYSLLIAVLLRCTPDPRNPMDLVAGLDRFMVAAFFLAWAYILRRISTATSSILPLIVFGYWVFVFSPLMLCPSCDLATLSIFSVAFALCLPFVKCPDRSIARSLLPGGLLGICASLRYAYLPLVLAPPLALLYLAWPARRKLFAHAVVLMVSALAICLLTYTAFSWGNPLPSTNWRNGMHLHWSNLKEFCPFPAVMLGFSLLTHLPGGRESYHQLLIFLRWGGSLIAIALLVFQLVRLLVKREIDGQRVEFVFCAITGAAVTLLTVCTVAYLSLRMPREDWCTPGWTYVQEERYFVLSGVFLVVFIFVELLSSRGVVRYLLFALVCCPAYWLFCGHLFEWMMPIALLPNRTVQRRVIDSAATLFVPVIRQLKREGKEVVFFASNALFDWCP